MVGPPQIKVFLSNTCIVSDMFSAYLKKTVYRGEPGIEVVELR